jgi:trans-aconitate 2-methyltransferase
MTWSAQQYVAFETERTRPVRDLLASVPRADARVAIDLGCGPGNSTELLAGRFPGAAISGLDSSPDMIEVARQRLPGVDFALADLEAWIYGPPPTPGSTAAATPAHFDVILANAVLQWLPDHARLIPALFARLTVGGVLAVQVPDNLEEPSHVLMREIAHGGPWAERLAHVSGRAVIATADGYYSLIRSMGGQAEVWRTTYYHPLAGGAGAIVEWFKGSGLRPYLALLTPAERADYLARYAAAVALAYPAMADGTVLLPFPRLFLVVVR